MVQTVRKAVFPVAGLGTRFLPATKANPKEMLPIVDKPLIQYAAEEAVSAGINMLIFITGRNKRSIADHFDKAYELEAELQEQGNTEMLDVVRNILPPHVSCVYIRQTAQLGLGHAVLCAEKSVGEEPFAVLLADDLIANDGKTCLQQMIDIYEEYKCSVIGVQEISIQDVHRYGVVDGETLAEGVWKIRNLVEKPQPQDAPSNIAIVGRYILSPTLFQYLASTHKGTGGEIQLTDALAAQLVDEPLIAYRFQGKRYDCGSKLGYLQATTDVALKHSDLKDDYRAYLKKLNL